MSTSPREQQLLNRIASLTRRQEFLEGAVKIIAAIFIGLALGKLYIPWWGIAGTMALMYFFPILRWLGWPLALWCIYDGGSVEVKVIYCAMLVVTAFSHPVLKQLEKDIHTLINQVSDSTWAEIHAEQNPVQQIGPSPLVQQAISASKIIWRYVAYSFQSDAIPNGEIAFRYAIYSYAVSDLLRQKGIELAVRTHFSTSYAQADDKSTDDPLVANLQNVVNKTTEILGLAHPDPETQSGAYVILSSKEKVLHSNEVDTFAVTDADCVSFQRDVRHLRHEIDQLLAEPIPVPQQPQPSKKSKKSGVGWKVALTMVIGLSISVALIIYKETPSTLREQFTTTRDFYEALEVAETRAQEKGATMEDKLLSNVLIGYNVKISKLMQQREIQGSGFWDSEKYAQRKELKRQITDLEREALEAVAHMKITGVYAEVGGKRYNYSKDSSTGAECWFEITPKKKDGTDNWYYKQEQTVTKGLDITPAEYWNHRQMYDDFWYVAAGYDKNSTADDVIETARAVFGYERFAEYASVLKTLRADTDADGNPIQGTKFKKVQAFVDQLDIPDIEKKILMKMMYPSNNKDSLEIVQWLDENDDISSETFVKILGELGYKIDDKGYVTWE